MSKKSNKKEAKPLKSNTKETIFLDEEEENLEAYDEYFQTMQSGMMSMLPALLDQACQLTELIVANRVRNSEKIIDDDIHQIYKDAFQRITHILDESK